MIEIPHFMGNGILRGDRLKQPLSTSIIVLTGSLLFLFQTIHLFGEYGSLRNILLGMLPPMMMSTLIIGVGYVVHTQDTFKGYEQVFVGWIEAGIIGGIAFGYPIVPFQAAHGVQLVDISFVGINWASAGGVIGIALGFYDVRQRKFRARLREERNKLQSKKDQLERENNRLEQLASVISHDLRNPLNVAAGRVELAEKTGNIDHLERVHDAHQRAFEIIEDSLTMSRKGHLVATEDLDRISLSAQVIDNWAMTETEKGELSVEDDVTFFADKSRLHHVFENLFRNAVEHGGEDVSVRVGLLESADGFFVEDDGSGISEEERNAIFEPGFSTSDGTGLGLAIVKSIVDAHGWSISFTNSSAGGARFEISNINIPDDSRS